MPTVQDYLDWKASGGHLKPFPPGFVRSTPLGWADYVALAGAWLLVAVLLVILVTTLFRSRAILEHTLIRLLANAVRYTRALKKWLAKIRDRVRSEADQDR